jgi:hypothetical protein
VQHSFSFETFTVRSEKQNAWRVMWVEHRSSTSTKRGRALGNTIQPTTVPDTKLCQFPNIYNTKRAKLWFAWFLIPSRMLAKLHATKFILRAKFIIILRASLMRRPARNITCIMHSVSERIEKRCTNQCLTAQRDRALVSAREVNQNLY